MTTLPSEQLLLRLDPPRGRVDMVLDTDTFNEIDDAFALVYAALSTEKLNLLAVHAAPFHNERSAGAGDGMEKSHAEILRIFALMGRDPEGVVFKGARAFTGERVLPESSPAAENLIRLARSMPEGKPLYVAAIAALTNIANALRLAPDLVGKLVVVWLGGISCTSRTTMSSICGRIRGRWVRRCTVCMPAIRVRNPPHPR